jgi:hypothetical protein
MTIFSQVALNLQEYRVGRASCTHLAEHGIRNDDFGHPRAKQVELPDLGEQDQGRGVDDPSDRRCHDSSSSLSSSAVT